MKIIFKNWIEVKNEVKFIYFLKKYYLTKFKFKYTNLHFYQICILYY